MILGAATAYVGLQYTNLSYTVGKMSSSISTDNQQISSLQAASVSQQSVVSSLESSITQVQEQESSLSLQVPDSTIMTVHYNVQMTAKVMGTTITVPVSVQQTIGLPYHSGQPIQLYLGGNQLGNVTGSLSMTTITSTTPGFTVTSVSPSLPQAWTAASAPMLTITLSSAPGPFHGDVDLTVQANYTL